MKESASNLEFEEAAKLEMRLEIIKNELEITLNPKLGSMM